MELTLHLAPANHSCAKTTHRTFRELAAAQGRHFFALATPLLLLIAPVRAADRKQNSIFKLRCKRGLIRTNESQPLAIQVDLTGLRESSI